jgi:hypothetical protein
MESVHSYRALAESAEVFAFLSIRLSVCHISGHAPTHLKLSIYVTKCLDCTSVTRNKIVAIPRPTGRLFQCIFRSDETTVRWVTNNTKLQQ